MKIWNGWNSDDVFDMVESIAGKAENASHLYFLLLWNVQNKQYTRDTF